MNDFDQLRADTLTDIAALIRAAGMPGPLHIGMHNHSNGVRSLSMRLDEENRDGVSQWADQLGIDMLPDRHLPPDHHSQQGFTVVKAETWGHNRGSALWRGWDHIEVWAACEREIPGGES